MFDENEYLTEQEIETILEEGLQQEFISIWEDTEWSC